MAGDYYAVLGVSRDADTDEIKRAFRRLTLECHPDRHPDDEEAAERYRKISEAYDVLGDTARRARYDSSMRLPDGLDLSGGLDVRSARDLLGNVFGDLLGSKRRQRRRGRDVRYTLTVPLEEAVLGSTHHIEFEAPGPCSTCNGSGTRPGGRLPEVCPLCAGRGEVRGSGLLAGWTRCGRCDGTGKVQVDACDVCRGKGKRREKRAFDVRLPPGTEHGAQRLIEGRGEPGRFGGEPGDLRVTVNVRPHPRLSRSGSSVECEVVVSLTEAALGTSVRVPTVDGPVSMRIPPGLVSGSRLRLRGKGVPQGRSRGDQLVTVTVETPTTGSSRVREVLEALEVACSEDSDTLPRRTAQRLGDAPDGAADADADSRESVGEPATASDGATGRNSR